MTLIWITYKKAEDALCNSLIYVTHDCFRKYPEQPEDGDQGLYHSQFWQPEGSNEWGLSSVNLCYNYIFLFLLIGPSV